MKPQSHLAFHLAFWGMIALVLVFSSPSHAAVWKMYGQASSTDPLVTCQAYWDASMVARGAEEHMPIGVWRDGLKCWREAYPGSAEQYANYDYYRCDDGSYMSSTEIDQGYCDGEDPPPEPVTTDPQCEQKVIEWGSAAPDSNYCVDGTTYTTAAGYDSVNCGITDTPQGVRFEVDGSSYGWATSTGRSCALDPADETVDDAGIEEGLNPQYNLPVLPKTSDSVEINGQEIPLVESGCGMVGGSAVCTNDPGCGEFNGEWICTGPDNGTPGVPAQPSLDYTVSGTTSADRAGDQYFYDSTTVANSTNMGTGGSSDPADDGEADPRTDGSDTGDSMDPLGQGSCPQGYVQAGLTANADGSTDVQCAPDGDQIDWMGWADKFNMSDQLPDGWLDTPPIPGVSGPSSSCPAPQEFSFGGASFELPYDAFCDLAGMLRPLLILIGYMVAGWFIFRMVGGGK